MKRALLAVLAVLILAVACGPTPEADPDAGLVVELRDYSVTASVATVKAGSIKVGIRNLGSMVHDLTIIKSDAAPDQLPYNAQQARADETTMVGKEVVNSRGAGSLTVTLEPGKYVLICNVPGHYQLGMRTGLTVE